MSLDTNYRVCGFMAHLFNSYEMSSPLVTLLEKINLIKTNTDDEKVLIELVKTAIKSVYYEELRGTLLNYEKEVMHNTAFFWYNQGVEAAKNNKVKENRPKKLK